MSHYLGRCFNLLGLISRHERLTWQPSLPGFEPWTFGLGGEHFPTGATTVSHQVANEQPRFYSQKVSKIGKKDISPNMSSTGV